MKQEKKDGEHLSLGAQSQISLKADTEMNEIGVAGVTTLDKRSIWREHEFCQVARRDE